MGVRNPKPGTVILAEVGTLSMELGYLSHITKIPTLIDKAHNVVEVLSKLTSKYSGLLPKLLDTSKTHQDGGSDLTC